MEQAAVSGVEAVAIAAANRGILAAVGAEQVQADAEVVALHGTQKQQTAQVVARARRQSQWKSTIS